MEKRTFVLLTALMASAVQSNGAGYEELQIHPGNGVATNVTEVIGGAVNVTVNPGTSGGGLVTLSAPNTYYGTTRLGCGTLIAAAMADGLSPSAVGASSAERTNLVIGAGTFRYSGPTVTTDRGLTLNPGGAAKASILNTDSDITFGGKLVVETGGFVKTGSGTVTLAGAGTNVLGATSGISNGSFDARFVATANGDAPSQGFGSLTVLNGTLVLGTNPQQVTLLGATDAAIGSYTATAAGQETAGNLDIYGGTHIFNCWFQIGRQNGNPTTAPVPLSSRVRIFGGSVTISDFAMGRNRLPVANYKARPVLEVRGGSLTVSGSFRIGDDKGADCSVLLTGGTVKGGTLSFGAISGGTTNSAWVSTGAYVDLSVCDLGVADAYTLSTLHLAQGGQLRAYSVKKTGAKAVGVVRFNGGSFLAYTSSGAGSFAANVQALVSTNGAVLDRAATGSDFAFNAGLAHDPALGGSPDGGLIKTGVGPLTLNGTNTYSGPTVLTNGSLIVNVGLPPTTALSICPGSRLVLTNGLMAQSVGSLAVGAANVVGTWDLAVGVTNGASGLLVVSNALTAVGANPLKVWLYTPATGAGVSANGTYTLMEYPTSHAAAVVTGSASVGNPVTGKLYVFSTSDSAGRTSLRVTVSDTPAGQVWINAAGGAWETGANWLSGTPANEPGALATFSTEAQAGGATVSLAAEATIGGGSVSSSSPYTWSGGTLVFNNGGTNAPWAVTAGSHTFASAVRLDSSLALATSSGAVQRVSGGVSGEGALRLNPAAAGGGTVVLAGANTHGGGTTLGCGTVEVESLADGGEACALGGASSDAANLVLGPGTLRYTGPSATTDRGFTLNAGSVRASTLWTDADLTVGGSVVCLTGALMKRGSGTLTFSGARPLSLGNQQAPFTFPFAAFPDNGDSHTKYFGGLTVADGKLVLGADGQTAFVGQNCIIGSRTTDTPGQETTGELIINGGTTRFDAYLEIGYYNGTSRLCPEPMRPKMTLNGGTVSARHLYLNYDNNCIPSAGFDPLDLQNSQAELEINGGELVVDEQFHLGCQQGSNSLAIVSVRGGTLRHTYTGDAVYFGDRDPGGHGVLNLFGGLFEAALDIRMGRYGAKSWLNLHGGTLRASNITKASGTGTTRLYFNGGVFQPNTAGQTLTGHTSATVSTNGAAFDTSLAGAGGYTVNQVLLHDPDLGEAADGGLLKLGTGLLIAKNVAHTFTGPAVVSNGTLRTESTALRRNVVRVAPGAALQVDDFAAAAQVGDLVLGDAESASAAQLDLPMNDATMQYAGLTVTNTLTLNKAVIGFHRQGTAVQVLPLGVYTVLTYNATSPEPDLSGLSVSSESKGAAFSLVDGAPGWMSVVMTVVNAYPASAWQAPGDGAWETAENWLNPPQNLPGWPVLFTNDISASGASVSLADAKTAGALTFDAANSFTLSGGPLSLDNEGTPLQIKALRGSHTLASDVALAFQTDLDSRSNAALTVSGVISGTSALTVNPLTVGGGRVTLSGANTYSGLTKSVSGTLVIDTLANGGQPSSIGASGTNASNWVIGPGTVHYTGPDVTTDRSLQLSPGTSRVAIFRNDHDVTLRGQLTSLSGATVKAGTGTLHIAGAGTQKLCTDGNGTNWNLTRLWPSNGDSPNPTYQTGFPGLLVDEGKLVLGGAGHTVNVNGEFWVGSQNRGWDYATRSAEVDILGGTLTLASTLSIGRNFKRADGESTYATVNQYGGALTCQHLILGYDLAQKSHSVKATLNLYGGSLLSLDQFRLGQTHGNADNPAQATVNVFGGTLRHTFAGGKGGIQFGFMNNAAEDTRGGNGTLNLFGGEVLERDLVKMGQNASTSRLNLHGGALQAESIVFNAEYYPGGTAHVFFNGGVFRPLGSNAANRVFQNMTSAAVSTNGAIFDTSCLTAGAVYTNAQVLTHDPALGAAADGGLIKRGGGALALAVSNAFSGPVTVEQGVLYAAHGAAVPDLVTVWSNGVLDACGAVLTVPRLSGAGACVNGTVRIASQVSPGLSTNASPGAALSFANLTLAPGAVFVCHTTAGGLPGGTNDVLAVSGTLAAEAGGFIDFARTADSPLAIPYAAVVMTYGSCGGTFSGWKPRNTGHPDGKYALRVTRDDATHAVRVELVQNGTMLQLQ